MSRTLHPGVRFGPYEIHSLVGEGGLGEVWKASDRASGRHAALRVLPNPPSADPHRFDRFERDVHLLTSLNHPNIATIHGVFEADGVRALAFDWIDGVVLAERITHGAFPVDEALPVAVQIADALGAAHKHGVIHGDVRPSNIKLSAEGLAKVLDFGLAEIFEPESAPSAAAALAASARQRGVILGTAAYMSPEQVHGAPVDPRADVWAFGCVLFEMLTGKSPFTGDDLTETMTSIVSVEPEWALLPSTVPSWAALVLRRCLEKDARARSQNLTDISASIREGISEAGADEAFLRMPSLKRISDAKRGSALAGAYRDEIDLPGLKRWARTLVPRGADLHIDDIVNDVVRTGGKPLRFEPHRRESLREYLRRAVFTRIQDELRRPMRTTEPRPEGPPEGILIRREHQGERSTPTKTTRAQQFIDFIRRKKNPPRV
ncbi:MAG TPA: serine/threonine-protein kinase [Vicinamibacterales bacterium]|nr:serine/threonine-protein kinase [Vicinamibacterales bacterium]